MDKEKALKGFSDFVNAVEDGTMRAERGKAMRTEINNHIIDTCLPGDTKKWETAIERGRNGEWIIVEQYENIRDATRGHTKWVEKIKENINCELKDMDLWGLED